MIITKAIQMFESKAAFARAIGISPQFLVQIEHGTRPTPVKAALAVQRVTNGAVTVHDLRPDIFGPAPGSPQHIPQDQAA